ncbi:MAG: hypothetical protein BAJALOKI2v1_250001 [Promethearchaeota archaeon]|nr:MAG: hypothetical protein BAJALOKI2v1_250001 [Candidatus Lokiarchaeota archaeon]
MAKMRTFFWVLYTQITLSNYFEFPKLIQTIDYISKFTS